MRNIYYLMLLTFSSIIFSNLAVADDQANFNLKAFIDAQDVNPICPDKSKSRSMCKGDVFTDPDGNEEPINSQREACKVLKANPPQAPACDDGCTPGGTNTSVVKVGDDCCTITVTQFCGPKPVEPVEP